MLQLDALTVATQEMHERFNQLWIVVEVILELNRPSLLDYPTLHRSLVYRIKAPLCYLLKSLDFPFSHRKGTPYPLP